MIEMGGDACLVPFIDIYPPNDVGGNLTNYGTKGSLFFGYWQPPNPPFYEGYWTANWFPSGVAFPYGEDYGGLAKTATDFDGDVLDPVSFTCEVGPGGVAWQSQTYYYDYDTGGGWNLVLSIADFSAQYECEIFCWVSRAFQGASPLWEVEWYGGAGVWSPGDTVGFSVDPVNGEAYLYVNDTKIDLSGSLYVNLGAGVTNGFVEGEQIYFSGFDYNGDESGFIPPERFTVSRGMLSSATSLCGPDDLPATEGCHFITFYPPSLSSVGDGRLYDMIPSFIGDTYYAAIEGPGGTLDLRLPGEDYCASFPDSTWQIATGGLSGLFAQMITNVQNYPFSFVNGNHSQTWQSYLYMNEVTVQFQFEVGAIYKPNGLSGIDWFTGGRVQGFWQTRGGGYYVDSGLVDVRYDGSLDVAGSVGALIAAAGACSNVNWTYATDGSSTLPLGTRLYTFTGGSTLWNINFVTGYDTSGAFTIASKRDGIHI